MSEVRTVLLADDDEGLLTQLAGFLTAEGFHVTTVTNGEAAIAKLQQQFDFAILDQEMPNAREQGRDVLRWIRYRQINTKVIIMTRPYAEDEDFQIGSLRDGADEFMPKPFGHGVLRERIRLIDRRNTFMPQPYLSRYLICDKIKVDLDRHQVMYNNQAARLGPRSYHLLYYFMINANQPLSFEQLLDNVWTEKVVDYAAAIPPRISDLRDRLYLSSVRTQPPAIVSVHNYGYEFVGHVEVKQ